jgi:tetratricopeptide (TPR) repeat protein
MNLHLDKIEQRIRAGIPWWIGLLLLAMVLVVPNIMATKLSKIWLQYPGIDKPTHFSAFLAVFLVVYGMLHGLMRPASRRGRLGLAVCISLGISLADEVQQAVLGIGRTAEYGDLVADAAGIFVGLTGMTTGQLGAKRAVLIVALLLIPVAMVTVKTYHDLEHYNRGMMYEREHDYQRARAEYQLALDSGFQSAQLYNAIAWLDVEFLAGDPVKIETYAARAFAMDPDNPDIIDTYGWILVQAGRHREGLALLERAKSMKPTMYCIDLHLGVAYTKTGDRVQAVEHLKRQIERNQTDRWGRSAKSEIDRLEGNSG